MDARDPGGRPSTEADRSGADEDAAPIRSRPGFFATLGLVLRGLGGSLGTCVALSTPPALLVGAASGLLQPLGAADGPPSSISGALATSVVTIAAMGTVTLAVAVVVPLSAAGLAWVGVRAAAGEQVGPSEAMERVVERGPHAVGAFLGAVLAVAAAPAALGLLALVGGALGGELVAGALSLLVVASLVWPAFVYWVRFSLAVPAAVADGESPIGALRRSAERVRGGFWWVLGILVVTAVAAALVGALLQAPFAVADGSAAALGAAIGQALSFLVSLCAAGVTAGVLYAVRGLPDAEAEPVGVVRGESSREEWPGPGI